MSYLLEGLLRLRRTREDRAQRELSQARAALATAARALEQARQVLSDYRQWRPREEARLWTMVIGHDVRRTDLDDHQRRLQTVANGEREREEKCAQAEKTVQEAQKLAEERRQTWVRALRNVQKLEEHKEMELAREAKEAENRLENELEDSRHFVPAESLL
jgi:type III secretion protein O